MGLKIVLSIILSIVMIGFLIIYWFFPIQNINFELNEPVNSNFSISGSNNMQFYPNMRYPSKIITYKIEDCPLQRKNDMEYAFDILSGKTILEFYPVDFEELILITCDETVKMSGEFFVAGEGGPTNITATDLFNVIEGGRIFLFKDSECPKPNVAIHELLHALGFNHSENRNNIMYYMSKCNQDISEDIINLINELYTSPSLPDLSFENVSAELNSRYLNCNIIIKNNGLMTSEKAEMLIYAEDKVVKKIDIKPLEVGYGVELSMENAWVPIRNPRNIKFVVESSFEELDKENNLVVLVQN